LTHLTTGNLSLFNNSISEFFENLPGRGKGFDRIGVGEDSQEQRSERRGSLGEPHCAGIVEARPTEGAVKVWCCTLELGIADDNGEHPSPVSLTAKMKIRKKKSVFGSNSRPKWIAMTMVN
jgi:hypothetical protein